ncbi:MAG TPA: DUF1553 domain-containing protein [Roseimicrobium sp.]|nr:DUF1553 domain-containing protein [Roseimicrobium sp.]
MPQFPNRLTALSAAIPFLIAAAALFPASVSAAPATGGDFFESQVRPLFEKHCTECHGEKKQKADLRLDLKSHAFKGGENGAVIVAGDSGKSPLFQRVVSQDSDNRMPPKGSPLTGEQAGVLKTWIDSGAIWPETEADRAATVDKRLQHWSLQPIKAATEPGASVDHYIQKKLKEAGLKPSPQADRRTLIRRLSFNLIGLPPTPEEVDAFEKDRRPDAYERLVERLLASPQFGERWGRHWLDVVRFAESDGFEMNRARPNAWPYRDYVIRAFNEDRPFDRFIREQLAGDALGEDAATGFLVGGPWDQVKSKDPVLTANQRADELHDMVSTTAATFLGLTVNCARCHDHKFDPIPARDYYAMTAMLQGVQHGERPVNSTESAANQKQVAALREELVPVETALAKFQPLARLNRVLLLDDTTAAPAGDKPGGTAILPTANGQPVTYTAGKARGQADDPGDIDRLPNLGIGYRYWTPQAGKHENLFTWSPRLNGRQRIWVSWGAWTTHTKDARYILDLDGDFSTTADQKEIATVDQSRFADGTPAIEGEKRWSGFRNAGEHELNANSVVILRAGDKGGPHVADVVAFEEVLASTTPTSQPALRSPAGHLANEDRFAPVRARFLRFTITESGNTEPCLDELEIYSAGTNVASAAHGTKASSSGTYDNSNNSKHRLSHINDGKYGNDFSWISNTRNAGWVQLEFPGVEEIDRVVWSRDRGNDKNVRPFEDRLATGYRIETSLDGKEWRTVASSADRLDTRFRQRFASVPTLNSVPAAQAGEVAALAAKRSRLLQQIAGLSRTAVVYAGKFSEPGSTHRNHRGDPTQPKEIVPPGALSRIGLPLTLPESTPERERRLALANWIANPNHPLTARVIVNRIWHYHFGTGIVDTPSDFGINGSRPTHPELLDYLAQELVKNNWSLKHIHRLILLSSTYRQSSASVEKSMKVDSASRLLWRFPPRRLEAEALRDAILATTGKLDLKMGGPGFDLFEANDNYVKVYVTKSDYGPAEFRRMVYQSKPRTMLDDFFGAFDCPDAGQPAPRRTSSTTPLQALNLLNSHFALQQAGFLADRAKKESDDRPEHQITRAFQLAFGRKPTAAELADSRKLVAQHGLPILCRALLNANEFIRLN